MAPFYDIARTYASSSIEALVETLWPTRCAVCDAFGEVLCEQCLRQLSNIDWWRACPRCGAPFGRVQCSECNSVILAHSGYDQIPFDGCASAVVFDENVARIVRIYKDQGERRLAHTMASLMARMCLPAWEGSAITYIPASAAAHRRRGFDHAELLSEELASLLDATVMPTLQRPQTSDQRKLSRQARWENLAGRFHVLPEASLPPRILLVDDVYTTGATLFDAANTLKEGGAKHVYVLTFARVW